MPVNVVKSPRDERLWEKAKRQAKKQGRGKSWPYIMGIFQRMKKGHGGARKKVAMRLAAIIRRALHR